jgi:hypothetical protein
MSINAHLTSVETVLHMASCHASVAHKEVHSKCLYSLVIHILYGLLVLVYLMHFQLHWSYGTKLHHLMKKTDNSNALVRAALSLLLAQISF